MKRPSYKSFDCGFAFCKNFLTALYGAGWTVGIVISPFKRRSGGAVQSAGMENTAAEMGHKVMIHNRMLAVASGAIANA